MTFYGGDFSECSGLGCGVVFKVAKSGKETVLYRFTGGADGAGPYAGVVGDATGNPYGTKLLGGEFTDPLCIVTGCGLAFKLGAAGQETVLHTFTGG